MLRIIGSITVGLSRLSIRNRNLSEDVSDKIVRAKFGCGSSSSGRQQQSSSLLSCYSSKLLSSSSKNRNVSKQGRRNNDAVAFFQSTRLLSSPSTVSRYFSSRPQALPFFRSVVSNTIILSRSTLLSSYIRSPQSIITDSIIQRLKHTIKTNSSVAKRFRIRNRKGGAVSLVRSHSGTQHNTGYKARSRSNKLGQSTTIKSKAMESKMKRCLGV